jgi:phosphocarrier protein
VSQASATVLIAHPTGLHARPAVKLTKLAKSFDAAVKLRAQGQETWIDAKSIVKVMATKAPANRLLHLRASGADASEAVTALADLVRRDFDEGASDVAHG